MSKLPLRALLATIARTSAGVSITGCSTSPNGSVSAYIDDTVITTKVKSEFADATQVDATSINVETINGTVLLRGVA